MLPNMAVSSGGSVDGHSELSIVTSSAYKNNDQYFIDTNKSIGIKSHNYYHQKSIKRGL